MLSLKPKVQALNTYFTMHSSLFLFLRFISEL